MLLGSKQELKHERENPENVTLVVNVRGANGKGQGPEYETHIPSK